jgi:hypothetical protein
MRSKWSFGAVQLSLLDNRPVVYVTDGNDVVRVDPFRVVDEDIEIRRRDLYRVGWLDGATAAMAAGGDIGLLTGTMPGG